MLLRSLLLAFLVAGTLSPTLAQSDAPLYGITSCCPNLVVEFDPATGGTTPVVEIGGAEDGFIATVGSGVLDPAARQVYLVRNDTLIAVDLDAGTVSDVGAPEAFAQFAGFDAARGLIYAFTVEAEADEMANEVVYTNRLLALDPSDASAEEIAVVGEGVSNEAGYEGDLFSSVTGPAITGSDPFRLFTVRNGQLLTVDLPSGELTEGTDFGNGQLLAYAPSTNGILVYERSFEPDDDTGMTGSFTYFVRERDAATGDLLAEVVVGTGALIEGGNYEGDVYTASLGMAVFDAPSDRVFLNRNGQLVAVDLADGLVTQYETLGNVRIVGSAAPITTAVGADSATPGLSLASYPNPFRHTARLEVTLDRPQTVEIAAYDVLGRRVAVLHRGPLPAGTLALDDVGRSLPAGTYVIRVQGERVQQSLRLTRVD